MAHSPVVPRSQVRNTPPFPAVNGCDDGSARVSAATCHRPEPDLHVVEATGNTIRCGLSSGRISLPSSRDNDATGNGNIHPSCSEISEGPREILTEIASSGRARSFRPAGHLHQEDLAPFCQGSPKDMHVSSAPGHLEDSTRQASREQTDSNGSRPDVGRTSCFPLTRRPARSPCHPSQGTPGA